MNNMKWRFIGSYILNRWCNQVVSDYLEVTFFHSYAANELPTLNNVVNTDLIKTKWNFLSLMIFFKNLV